MGSVPNTNGTRPESVAISRFQWLLAKNFLRTREVGGLVGGGDSDLLGILRPYYSMVEMTANGNKQGMGQYLHVLPDSSEGDTPIYSVGGSMYGGVEPAGAKLGYMNRPFGKKR
uniref:Uncharacterized protein n=1 Tax=Caenorhabditis japonica TaxID=281687 RepID=A0A8R1HUB9_CAEJA